MDNSDEWLDRQEEYELESQRGFEDGLDGVLSESDNPDYLEGFDDGRKCPGSIVKA
jgi:hypothetical protein